MVDDHVIKVDQTVQQVGADRVVQGISATSTLLVLLSVYTVDTL